ncbi:DUF2452 domain-containing protein [Pollutibacter soli]|uniref:DUF2452 domain-containing protein n=1 Tax=Pollutibacter soli TaxID=3034157 RepID=UPI003013FCA0
MIKAYNFLASWQLFPEKGSYEQGERPRSGIFKLATGEDEKTLHLSKNWVTLDNHAFSTEFDFLPDNEIHPFDHSEVAEEYRAFFEDGIHFEISFFRNKGKTFQISYSIMPDGYLMIKEEGLTPDHQPYCNQEYYHKQMQVLPYSASVSGAVIRPTKEGVIRHKALTAMEEQTQMQMEQIRRQIELLALQAQEIQKRKELSLIIYYAKLSFSPVIGQCYYLYEKNDGSHVLSMISPKEWGGGAGPYRKLRAAVKLLADHTWVEL